MLLAMGDNGPRSSAHVKDEWPRLERIRDPKSGSLSADLPGNSDTYLAKDAAGNPGGSAWSGRAD